MKKTKVILPLALIFQAGVSASKSSKEAPQLPSVDLIMEQTLLKGGSTLTVGPGNDCGFPNILTALNFAGIGDTIMVAEGTYTGVEAKLTINKSLSLWGGLDSNCQVFTANRTVLQLDDIGPVIDIDVSGGDVVNLSGLEITGSQHDNFNDYDGGISVHGDGELNIENTLIYNNESHFGGGIAVTSGAELNLSGNTEIFSNTAVSSGGGIYCSGSSTINAHDTVIGRFDNGMDQGNSLSGTESTGGGISASSCSVSLGNTINGNGPVDISYNKSNSGGGIHAHNSTLTFHYEGSRMTFNELLPATGGGNSVYLTGNSFAQLSDLEISDNKFASVFSVNDTASLVIGSVCSESPCFQIKRNSGTVFRFTGGTTGSISKTVVTENTAGKLIQVVAQSPTEVNVRNTIFANNSYSAVDSDLIFTNSSGDIYLTNNTFAENTNDHALFYTLGSASINVSGNIIWGNAAANLIHDSNQGDVIVSDSVIQYDPTGMTNTLQMDPLFMNSANGDFRIQGDSPAVDHFDGTLDSDFEGDLRPQGLADDAGADEFKDLISIGDFEI